MLNIVDVLSYMYSHSIFVIYKSHSQFHIIDCKIYTFSCNLYKLSPMVCAVYSAMIATVVTRILLFFYCLHARDLTLRRHANTGYVSPSSWSQPDTQE